MKKYITLFLTVTLLAGAYVHAAPPVYSVAVFDFESKDENVRGQGGKIATLINADLSADPQIVTVEREELAKVVGGVRGLLRFAGRAVTSGRGS